MSRVEVIVHRQADLLHVVGALRACGKPRAPFAQLGTKSVIRMAMIAITTSNSIKVNARPPGRWESHVWYLQSLYTRRSSESRPRL